MMILTPPPVFEEMEEIDAILDIIEYLESVVLAGSEMNTSGERAQVTQIGEPTPSGGN